MADNIEFHLTFNPAFQRSDLFIVDKSNGRVLAAKPLEYDEVEEGNIPAPTERLTNGELQTLMDTLWRNGFRPGGNTPMATDNMKAHLEDMRRLVFEGRG